MSENGKEDAGSRTAVERSQESGRPIPGICIQVIIGRR